VRGDAICNAAAALIENASSEAARFLSDAVLASATCALDSDVRPCKAAG
jgi:hypothetical protein